MRCASTFFKFDENAKTELDGFGFSKDPIEQLEGCTLSELQWLVHVRSVPASKTWARKLQALLKALKIILHKFVSLDDYTLGTNTGLMIQYFSFKAEAKDYISQIEKTLEIKECPVM